MRLPPESVARRLDCIRISNDIGSCLGLFHSKQMAPDDGRSVHPARAHQEPSVLVETNLSHNSRDQNTPINEKGRVAGYVCDVGGVCGVAVGRAVLVARGPAEELHPPEIVARRNHRALNPSDTCHQFARVAGRRAARKEVRGGYLRRAVEGVDVGAIGVRRPDPSHRPAERAAAATARLTQPQAFDRAKRTRERQRERGGLWVRTSIGPTRCP